MAAPPFIHRSPRPQITLPQDPNTSLVTFLFRNHASLSDSSALVDNETGNKLTFSDLKNQVSRFSNALLNLNISKNDVVLIFSPNSILFPVSFLAIVSIGAIVTTANPQYTTNELAKQVQDAKPKLVITTHQLYHKIKNFNLPCILLTPKNSSPRIMNSTTQYPIWYYSELVHSDSSSVPSSTAAQSDVAALLYSSGTTGTSKGVVLTHKNFIAAALVATSDQEVYRDDNKNIVLCFLPLFHIFGLSFVLYAQLQRGNTVVVMEKYEMNNMLKAIERYNITHLYVVPSVVQALVRQPKAIRDYDASSLKEILSGAAPLGKEAIEQCSKIFPRTRILQAYGMTEVCGIISMENARVMSSTRNYGSSGMLASGFESLIIDLDTLKPLPPFQKGEIWVRGPSVMKGYYNNSKATEDVLNKTGWLHTGDLGYFDNEGQLYVVDRLKELIKCKGFQVAPAELEEILLSHPEITDAAVIPLPDAEAGEVPIAFVVQSSTASINENDVQKFVAEQVAPFKRLRKVTFMDSIPRSASGKILRRELKHNINFVSKL